jgi:hypothetical protein
MAIFKFDKDDIFINTLEAYPEYSFYVVSGTVYIDNMPHKNQTNPDVPDGWVSLYEINNDRPADQRIYPFVTKDGTRDMVKTYDASTRNIDFVYGDQVTGSYDLKASIDVDYYAAFDPRPRVSSLRNAFEHNKLLSPRFEYRSTEFGNKDTQQLGLVSIPSIFYGERIKKGSVKLDYYLSGTLIGTLEDTRYNGELVQTYSYNQTNDGEVAGLVFYKEGAIALTGSWELDGTTLDYNGVIGGDESRWVHFGSGLHEDISSLTTLPSASFHLAYQGVTHTNTMMMMAHAKYGELNYSNNPTYKDQSHPNYATADTGSVRSYVEAKVPPKNITHTELTDVTPELKRETYISKIALYDEDKNIIGYAKVATPVRKTEDRQYTFKLKLDL